MAIAALLFTLMTTWKTGRGIVAASGRSATPLTGFFHAVEAANPVRVPLAVDPDDIAYFSAARRSS